MVENKDQIALRRWIHAGLCLEEVRSLHGDAKYLFNNMIAKYTLAADIYLLSANAEEKLIAEGVDFSKPLRRGAIYGKDRKTIFEHSIPATVVRSKLLESTGSEDEVISILRCAGQVVVIGRDEDAMLKAAGLNSRMPEGWVWGNDEFARYQKVGISLSQRNLKVYGGIVR